MNKHRNTIALLCLLCFVVLCSDKVFATEAASNTTDSTVSSTEQITTEANYKEQWIKKDGNYYYQKRDGSILQSKGIVKIDKYKYCLGSGGKRLTGVNKVGKKLYYFNPKNGRMVEKAGWKKVKGKKYYIKKGGVLVTGMKKIGKTKYRFLKNGELSGFSKPFKYKGKWYRTNKKGVVEKLSKIQVSCSKATCKYIDKHTSSKMSKKKKLRTLFYCLESGNYVPGCIDRSETESKYFPYKIASKVLSNGRLNCYGQACTFASFAKELGYEPYVVVMDVDHAVVMIDGKYYDNMGAKFGTSKPTISDFKVYKKVKF